MNALTVVELVCTGDHVDLCNAADAIGSALAARGVEPGDRVAAALAPDGDTWVAALVGVVSIRAAFTPLPDVVDEASARSALRAAGARVLLASASAALPAGLRAAAAALEIPIVRVAFDNRGTALVDGEPVYDAHGRIAEPGDVAFAPLGGEPQTHAALVAAAGRRGLPGLLETVGAPREALARAA